LSRYIYSGIDIKISDLIIKFFLNLIEEKLVRLIIVAKNITKNMFHSLKLNLYKQAGFKFFIGLYLNKLALGFFKVNHLIPVVCILFIFLGNQAFAIIGKPTNNAYKTDIEFSGIAISFITATNYYGTPSTFTITVNPTNPTIITNIASGTITACQGTPSASPNIQQFTVSGHFLTDNVTVTAPSGFEVSLSAGSGFASSLSLVKTADSVTNTTIYVRSSSTAPIGKLSDNILLSSTGATGQSVLVTANINPLVNPSININSSAYIICAGTAVNFNASITNGGTSPTYQWLLNGKVVGTNTTTYSSNTLADGDVITCTLASNIACVAKPVVNSNNITIKVGALPTVNAGGDKTIKKGLSTVLNATITGEIADITWSPIEGLNNFKILNPIASPLATTKYTVTVVTTSGCIDESSATVTVINAISIPNAFSPNGDGINDTWNIKDIAGYPNCTVDIFNRYGTKVYSSRGYGIAWDGRYNNADSPVGTYYYIINLNDGSKIISGYVTLIR
jgi:gliding motility-associated-like protein